MSVLCAVLQKRSVACYHVVGLTLETIVHNEKAFYMMSNFRLFSQQSFAIPVGLPKNCRDVSQNSDCGTSIHQTFVVCAISNVSNLADYSTVS
jgi:hypothetical protein